MKSTKVIKIHPVEMKRHARKKERTAYYDDDSDDEPPEQGPSGDQIHEVERIETTLNPILESKKEQTSPMEE
jgi:hypothetical protein